MPIFLAKILVGSLFAIVKQNTWKEEQMLQKKPFAGRKVEVFVGAACL